MTALIGVSAAVGGRSANLLPTQHFRLGDPVTQLVAPHVAPAAGREFPANS